MIFKSVGVIAAVLALAVAVGGKDAGAAPAGSNFIVNGDFDVDVSGWEVPANDVLVTHEASVDRYGDALSGSVRISNAPGGPSGVGIAQCLRVAEGIPVTLTGWVNLPAVSQPVDASVNVSVQFSSNLTCTSPVGNFHHALVVPAVGWQQAEIDTTVPAGALSMRVSLGVSKSLADPTLAYAYFDEVFAISAGDADGDGCLNGQELQATVALGGDRDPTDGWDFFDVPAPALIAGNSTGTKNNQVNLSDVLSIITFAGTSEGGPANANGADYDSDLNGNGVADGQEYDRTPSSDLARPWRSGAPSGLVTLSDALVALQQVGHSCAA